MSAPILNAGIARLPGEGRVPALAAGLLAALCSGTLGLLPAALPGGVEARVSFWVVLAGLFTFPIATGLYYLAAHAFGTRAELASQFAKVKPLLSILFALLLAGEALDASAWLSAALIMAGTLVIVYGARRGHLSWRALILGLLTALAWALGELFVKIGFDAATSIDSSFVALASSFLLFAVVSTPYLVRQRAVLGRLTYLPFFALHGVLSFGAAYTAFFHSIAVIGLADTILQTAFWPFLALLVTQVWNRLRGEPGHTPLIVWVAAGLLAMGSAVRVLTF
ncbi:MAG: hypothetical protein B0D96_00010 [Candidatus Sedimenticola endophacoides]|nr:MAG: hypothetical protein B0D96_00010 [Candidatus Sedimenticola endophacoides]